MIILLIINLIKLEEKERDRRRREDKSRRRSGYLAGDIAQFKVLVVASTGLVERLVVHGVNILQRLPQRLVIPLQK